MFPLRKALKVVSFVSLSPTSSGARSRVRKSPGFTKVIYRPTPSTTFIQTQHAAGTSSASGTERETAGTTETSAFCSWQEDSRGPLCARANLFSSAFFKVCLDRKPVQNGQWQPQRGGWSLSSAATTAARGSGGHFARSRRRSSRWYVATCGRDVKIHQRKPWPLTSNSTFLENMNILVW